MQDCGEDCQSNAEDSCCDSECALTGKCTNAACENGEDVCVDQSCPERTMAFAPDLVDGAAALLSINHGSDMLAQSFNFSSMGGMNSMGGMGSMTNMGNMNHMNNIGNLGNINGMGGMSNMSTMNNMNGMNNLNHMNTINGLNQNSKPPSLPVSLLSVLTHTPWYSEPSPERHEPRLFSKHAAGISAISKLASGVAR